MAWQIQTNITDEFSWIVPIAVKLDSIDHGEVQACSISPIPDKLRKPKEEAYRPNMVSIGLLHRGTTQLLLMEEPKWRYTRSLLHGTKTEEEDRLRDCCTTTLDLANVIQASYGGNLDLDPHEIAKVMLVDGCFLLQFFLRLPLYVEAQNVNDNFSDDPIFGKEKTLSCVLNDLTLLENQIPFIVLKKLFRKIFPTEIRIEVDNRVADIISRAFGYPLVPRSGVAHLLHLMHLVSAVNQKDCEEYKADQQLKHCATRLRGAGITIRGGKNTAPQRIKFVDSFDFNINFSNRTLEIAQLHIKETTEVKWRNMIAWEQSRTGIGYKFTSYALFFQDLICCEHDIELLQESEVIVNDSGKSKEDLRMLFRKITEGVDSRYSSYRVVCESLNKEASKSMKNWALITWHQLRKTLEVIGYNWQNWYRILIRDHIPTVWKFIGVLAAAALLALTITQTYYAAHNC